MTLRYALALSRDLPEPIGRDDFAWGSIDLAVAAIQFVNNGRRKRGLPPVRVVVDTENNNKVVASFDAAGIRNDGR